MDQTLNIITFILKGGIVTLKIYLVTAVFTLPLAVLCACGKVCRNKILRGILDIYTWVFRGTPLLLQIFFVYYGLPVIGIKLTEFNAACLTFILNYTAYLTEIIRAGIESINYGQFEASKVLGMSYFQTMVKIILPQAFKRVFPPICNEAINLLKDTALVTVIGMPEMLRNAKEIVTGEFIITPFIIAGIVYLFLTSIIVGVFKKLESSILWSD